MPALSPSPSHGFAAGPSLSPRRGFLEAAPDYPLLGEREGEGGALDAPPIPAVEMSNQMRR